MTGDHETDQSSGDLPARRVASVRIHQTVSALTADPCGRAAHAASSPAHPVCRTTSGRLDTVLSPASLSARSEVHVAGRTLHPFPARMAPDIALRSLAHFNGSAAVLDPMCGSGTVVIEAARAGHEAVGTDIDPMARLITSVATTVVSHDAVLKQGARALQVANSSRVRLGPWNCQETEEFARYWFDKPQYLALARLTRSIEEVATDAGHRKVLQLALSRLIITKSPKASLAADTSHSRPHKVLQSSTFDVLAAFLPAVRRTIAGTPSQPFARNPCVMRRDARTDNPNFRSRFDLIVTSPPYLNAIDYLRGHRLALIWFGHTIPDLRALRAGSIGSERRAHSPATTAATVTLAKILRDSPRPERIPAGMITRYAHDLASVAENIEAWLKPGGTAVLVVGDSTLHGNRIPNAAITSDCLAATGLTHLDTVTRTIPANRRYLPANDRAGAKLTKRMKTESVITFTKPQKSCDL